MSSEFIGIIRELDINGRIVIPSYYRKFLGASHGSKFAIMFNPKTKEITLKKVEE